MILKLQEIPYDAPTSTNLFMPTSDKPFLLTPAAQDEFGIGTIIFCLSKLQRLAAERNGLDYHQVFTRADGLRLWFIEDGDGGAITALLPSDY